MPVRSLLLSSLLSLAGLVACSAGLPPASVEAVSPGEATPAAPELIAEPGPATAESTPTSELLEPEAAFFAVFEALRDGDWAKFERFAGAPSIRFSREQSIGEVDVSVRSIPGAEIQAWLTQVYATWAPACSEMPDPPCMGLNPLALGLTDDAALRCVDAGPEDAGVLCCSYEPMLLHNTPFLAGVCFDAEQRVTQVSIIDG